MHTYGPPPLQAQATQAGQEAARPGEVIWRDLAWKPVVASPNVGCFLRLVVSQQLQRRIQDFFQEGVHSSLALLQHQ